MDPVWIVFAGVGAAGVGLIANTLARRGARDGVGTNGASTRDANESAQGAARGANIAVKGDGATQSGPGNKGASADATKSDARDGAARSARDEETDRESAARVALASANDADEVVEDPTGPIALILVTAHGQTDQGRHRTTNEDSFLVDPKLHLFAICDGMGGHAAGEVASQLAIETIARAHRTNEFDGEADPSRPRRGDQLVRAILMANRAVYDKAREDGRYHGMGTTAVAARFSPNKQRVYIAHVGDSRCYRFRAGKLRQITKDHTLGSLGVQGPTAGKLVRAVGTELKVQVDLLADAPESGDYYMLCSDGLSRMVSNEAMEQILADERDLDRAVAKLVVAANEAGGRDNITVILVRVDEA